MCKKCIDERTTMTVQASGLRKVFPWLSAKAASVVLDPVSEDKLVAKMERTTFRVLELVNASEDEGIQAIASLAIEELYSKTDSDKAKMLHSFMAYILNEIAEVIDVTPANIDTLYNLLFNVADDVIEAASKYATYGNELLQMLKSATWSMLGHNAGPAEFMKADMPLFITLVKRGLFDDYVKVSHYYQHDYRTLLIDDELFVPRLCTTYNHDDVFVIREEDAIFDPSIGGLVSHVMFEDTQEREWEIDPTVIIPVDDPDFNQHVNLRTTGTIVDDGSSFKFEGGRTSPLTVTHAKEPKEGSYNRAKPTSAGHSAEQIIEEFLAKKIPFSVQYNNEDEPVVKVRNSSMRGSSSKTNELYYNLVKPEVELMEITPETTGLNIPSADDKPTLLFKDTRLWFWKYS